jgi:catechol 2,3-dioxygenase-like lactoylglutathione lyase family enzyme
MRKYFVFLAVGTFLWLATPASAQLLGPNPAGVAMGHVHLFAKDVDALRRFLTALGGVPTQNGPLQMMRFPGAFVNMGQRDMSAGGSVGSVVNHFGFHVKDLAALLTRLTAAGFATEQPNPRQAFVTGPDDVRVELLVDDALTIPVRMHHVHLQVPSPAQAQVWYVTHFGAVAGKRGNFDMVTVPGGELTFSAQPMPQAPTQGRALDHIGFEVANLDAFLARLKALGISEIDGPRQGGGGNIKIAYVKDPWGTRIEMTEGLTPRP